jgi:hypothetical protein
MHGDALPGRRLLHGLQGEIRALPPQPKPEALCCADSGEDDDSYLCAKKDAGLALAAGVMNAGYNSHQEVYAAAKAVDTGMMEYDSDDNPIVVPDKRKIEAHTIAGPFYHRV